MNSYYNDKYPRDGANSIAERYIEGKGWTSEADYQKMTKDNPDIANQVTTVSVNYIDDGGRTGTVDMPAGDLDEFIGKSAKYADKIAEMKDKIDSLTAVTSKMFWSQDEKSPEEKACMGHLRIDFDKGNNFCHTWFSHTNSDNLKNPNFNNQFDKFVNGLRKNSGLLSDRASMRTYIRKHSSESVISEDGYAGFAFNNDKYIYCLRCKPEQGNYDCYLYVYDKAALAAERHKEQDKPKTKLATKHNIERD